MPPHDVAAPWFPQRNDPKIDMTSSPAHPRHVWLAQPRGFCAGVCRALATVETALERFGPPVFVNHEIVHNNHVTNDLKNRGVVFIQDLAEVPAGRPLIFSAHGVSAHFAAAARARGLTVIDATCPLVEKVHRKGRRAERAGRTIVLIGHQGHPEVVGTMGQMKGTVHLVENADDVAALPELAGDHITVLTQTTLTGEDISGVLMALSARFPGLRAGDDLCYATRNRQAAVRRLAARCPVILVVGSGHSSNSRRLVEVAGRAGAAAHLVETADDVRAEWLGDSPAIGITAAASTPELLVGALVTRLHDLGWDDVHELPGEPETIAFTLPKMPTPPNVRSNRAR
jgi:4-hydroxy-3-methylbut-2-enyl diphosphate reductase